MGVWGVSVGVCMCGRGWGGVGCKNLQPIVRAGILSGSLKI